MINKKPSTLIFSGVRGDTRRYRSLHPYQQLGIAGCSRRLSHLTDPNLDNQFKAAEIAIIHRAPLDAHLEKLITGLHSRGGLAVYDADDLVFDLSAFEWIDSPDFQDPVRARLYKEDMLRYRRTLDACDAVTVSTDYLAEVVKKTGKPVWTYRNAFSLEMAYYSEQARLRRKDHPGQVIIGYASGTSTHQKDLNLVRPALEQIFDKYPEAWLCLLGEIALDSTLARFASRNRDRIQRLPLVPWRQLPSEIARWDINLAPLVMDNPFTQSKSEIKYMEAALVGVPTVASPTDAFTTAIRPGSNGFLAIGDRGWFNCLEALMDAGRRNKMGQLASEQVLVNYHPEMRAGQLVQVLTEICHESGKPEWLDAVLAPDRSPEGDEGITSGQNPLWINQMVEDHPTLWEMGLYNLRHRSLWTLMQQAWVFFRRLAAPIFPYRQSKKIKPEI